MIPIIIRTIIIAITIHTIVIVIVIVICSSSTSSISTIILLLLSYLLGALPHETDVLPEHVLLEHGAALLLITTIIYIYI